MIITQCQRGLCSLNLDGRRLGALNFFEANWEAIDDIIMETLDEIFDV